MLVPIRQTYRLPPGMKIEPVEGDSPLLKRNPLVIKGRMGSDVQLIERKVHDYRIWDNLVEGVGQPPTSFGSFSSQSDPIQAVVQGLYAKNEESDEEDIQGVDSVTIIYPKELQQEIESMVRKCPPRILIHGKQGISRGGKAVHVRGKHGTRSLSLLLHCLDIEVDNGEWCISLNNSHKPGWVMYVPNDGPPMSFDEPVEESQAKEEKERVAWNGTEQLLRSVGLDVEGDPYPNGRDRFPDYGARIDGEEVDVEITSVPNLKPWTVGGNYRDLEKMCRDIARRKGETKESVIAELDEVVLKKKAILRQQRASGRENKCILVISNRSAVEIAGEEYWAQSDFSEFALVVLIEEGRAYVAYVKATDFRPTSK